MFFFFQAQTIIDLLKVMANTINKPPNHNKKKQKNKATKIKVKDYQNKKIDEKMKNSLNKKAEEKKENPRKISIS